MSIHCYAYQPKHLLKADLISDTIYAKRITAQSITTITRVHPVAAGVQAGGRGGVATKTGGTVYREVVERNARKYTKLTEDLVSEGRRLYERFGAAYTLWWFIREVWVRRKHAVRFQDLYRFHQRIAGVKSKYATLKALNRLKEYGLIASAYGKYYPLITDEMYVLGSIDFSRVRMRDQVVKPRAQAEAKQVQGGSVKVEELPGPVKRVIRLAEKLVSEGRKWEAVDLIAHTLLPVRMTGVLIAKIGDVFVYQENKTPKVHALKIPVLARIWEDLGLPKDKLWLHKKHPTTRIIRKEWGGYVVARKIHYALKEAGLEVEADKPTHWELWVDRNDSRMWAYRLRIQEGRMMRDWLWVGPASDIFNRLLELERRLQESEGTEEYWLLLSQYTSLSNEIKERFERVAAGAVVRREHVNEENEKSYFSRSPGML